MRKPERGEFPSDIESLPVADKAKGVLMTYLETEAAPTVSMSPTEASKLRKSIVQAVYDAAFYSSFPPKSLNNLADGLVDIVSRLEGSKKKELANRLNDLAIQMRSVSTSSIKH